MRWKAWSECLRAKLAGLRTAIRPGDSTALYKYLLANEQVCRLAREEEDRSRAQDDIQEAGGLCQLVFVDGCTGRFGLACGNKAREFQLPVTNAPPPAAP